MSTHDPHDEFEPAHFGRFTQRARNVVALARESALSSGDDTIGTEHLLIGLLGESDGVAAQVLVELAGSAEAITTALAKADKPEPGEHLGLTEDAKQVLDHATQEARTHLHNYVGTEHILLSLLAVPDSRGATVLAQLGIGNDAIRRGVLHKLGGFTTTG
ncbi:MAG TPA: Clp protease N-terminal domain-containing protein [Pseudonocardiaceae bacterium]|jgi:ATP-dependent Clp protease ATP-binding subunit ClpC